MGKLHLLLALLLCVVFVLQAGCTQTSQPGDAPEAETVEAQEESASPEVVEATPQEWEACNEALYPLAKQALLYQSWQGVQPEVDTYAFRGALQRDLVRCERVDGVLTATVVLHDFVEINPETLEEGLDGAGIPGAQVIRTKDQPHSPQLAVGVAVVEFMELGEQLIAVSCDYEAYQSPGLRYLQAQAAAKRQSSPVVASEAYDARLLDYVWRYIIREYYYVESPDRLTKHDLEYVTGDLDLREETLGLEPGEALDASLLRLMPNVGRIDCRVPLVDYSVFSGMRKLYSLRFYGPSGEAFTTLNVGYATELELYDPDLELLDLTGVNAGRLLLDSWSTAVGDITDGEGIRSLYIMSTRTDMSLINAENFPNVDYLNLYMESDMARVRDFSGLATFDEDVVIDLALNRRACNSETVQSLVGVQLRRLALNPSPAFPQDYDQKITAQLSAEMFYVEPPDGFLVLHRDSWEDR